MTDVEKKVLETGDKDLIELYQMGFLEVKIIDGEVMVKPTEKAIKFAERVGNNLN